MRDPVIIEGGHTFEREAIAQHIQSQESPKNPLTNLALNNLTVTPNLALKNVITDFLEQHPEHKKSQYQSSVIPEIQQAIAKWKITDLQSFIDKLVSVEDADDKARIYNFKLNNGESEDSKNEAFGFVRLILQTKPTPTQLTKVLNWIGEADNQNAILAVNRFGWNALHFACWVGNNVMVNTLLNKLDESNTAKAITAVDIEEWNALHLACRYGNDVMVKTLLNKLDESNTAKAITAVHNKEWNALHLACRYGNDVMVKTLLNKLDESNTAKAITAVNNHRWNALHFACQVGNNVMVRTLLNKLEESNATEAITAVNNQEWNALHLACRYGNNAIVNMLLNKAGNQATSVFAARVNKYMGEPVNMHPLELLRKNESAKDQEQILECLRKKFPDFFDELGFQLLQLGFFSNQPLLLSTLIKKTEEQLAKKTEEQLAKKARTESVTIRLPGRLFSLKKQATPEAEPKASETDNSVIRQMQTGPNKITS